MLSSANFSADAPSNSTTHPSTDSSADTTSNYTTHPSANSSANISADTSQTYYPLSRRTPLLDNYRYSYVPDAVVDVL